MSLHPGLDNTLWLPRIQNTSQHTLQHTWQHTACYLLSRETLQVMNYKQISILCH